MGYWDRKKADEELLDNNPYWKIEKWTDTLHDYHFIQDFFVPIPREKEYNYTRLFYKNNSGDWVAYGGDIWGEGRYAMPYDLGGYNTNQRGWSDVKWYDNTFRERADAMYNNAYSKDVTDSTRFLWGDSRLSHYINMNSVEGETAFEDENNWGKRSNFVNQIESEYTDLDDMGDEEVTISADGTSVSISHMGTEKLKELLLDIREGSPNAKYAAASHLSHELMNMMGNPEKNKEQYEGGTEAWDEAWQAIYDQLMNNGGNNELTNEDSIAGLGLSTSQQDDLNDALLDRDTAIKSLKADMSLLEGDIDDFYDDIAQEKTAMTSTINTDIASAREASISSLASAGQIATPEAKEYFEKYGDIATQKEGLATSQDTISGFYESIGSQAQPGPDGIWGTEDDILATGLHRDIGDEGFWAGDAGVSADYSSTGDYIGSDENLFGTTAEEQGYSWVGPTGMYQDIDRVESEFLETGREWFQSETNDNAKFDKFWDNLKDLSFPTGWNE
jgi:hypothetical protein